MMHPAVSGQSSTYVEFRFRVYDDGRRERVATVLVRGADGRHRPEQHPSGALARFVGRAILAAREEVSMGAPRRRAFR